jgi:integrase/recombinase XerD
MRAEATIYIDKLRPKKNGKCSIKIKVTFNGNRRHYSTGVELLNAEFDQIINGQRRTNEQKEINAKLNASLTKANDIISELTIFSFDSFENQYLIHRNTVNSVYFAFDEYIRQLKSEERLGTASSYQCARNSLKKFKKNLTFVDVTAKFLKSYENWVLDNDNSITTVGIYLRCLKSIYNLQSIEKYLYPFGQGNNKYTIPTAKNIKKALTIEEIGKIYHHDVKPNSTKERSKDYWLFLYLCNGMNVKDFCKLQWKNVEDDMLYYERSKTTRSKKETVAISVAIKQEAETIMNKWGTSPREKDRYIFPHFEEWMSEEKKRAKHQQLTKTINKYIKQIASDSGINKNVTTYFARHSFATILKNSGANINFISELMGHSSVQVTKSYLDSFATDQIQKGTDVLREAFNKPKE